MQLISYGQFSHGVFRWTDKEQKFSGKGCEVLEQEHTGSKPTTSCKVAVLAAPVSVVQPENDIFATKCACTINVPIYINRAWSTDVDLNVVTVEPYLSYNPSGYIIRPSVEGEDYTYSSGVVTITQGNTYENFSIDLLDNPADNVKNFFTINVTSIENRTICQNTIYSTIVVIHPTG